jgi:hypothetical protein
MRTPRLPDRWRARSLRTPEAIDLLELLLYMREQVLSGVEVEFFIRRPDINALRAFIQGMLFVSRSHRTPATGDHGEFFDWLRDVKDEFPAGKGWAGKCLEECGGDHRAAILRYLNLVAEFVELKEQAVRTGGKEEQP